MVPRLALSATLCGLLVACGGGGQSERAATGPAASGAGVAKAAASAPQVSVSVVRAQRRDVAFFGQRGQLRRDVAVQVEVTGTVSALSTVDIKPQLASVVTAVHVKDGQFVGKGQLLFTLDGRADAANLARAQAQLLRDQATLADAQRQLTRAQELLSQSFVSQGAVDTAQANVDAQRAALAADRAAIDAARVSVSYSRIVAPSSGRVGPSGPTMVSITQLDPIAVSFNLAQRNLPDALAALAAAGAAPLPVLPGARPAAGGASGAAAAALLPALAPGQVLAVLPEGRGLRVGRLDFVDNLVDPASGTVKVKALFGNKDQALWPGAYVNIKLSLQSLPGAVVVPQATIVQGARGTAVFVVGLASMRPVEVLQPLGDEAAVSGLKPGEKVVLDGRQNVRPGVRLIERGSDRPERAAGGASGGASGAAQRPAP